MRKNLSLLMSCAIALGMMFLWSCTNEETLLINNGVPVEKGKLSFVIPMGKSRTVTYATNIPGLDAEYAIENLYIFWFTKDGSDFLLKKTFKYEAGGSSNSITLSNTSLNAGGPSTVASISVGTEDTESRFYILANVDLSGKPVQVDLNLSTGTKSDDFEELFADDLQEDNGNLLHLTAPLPMSINKANSTCPGGSQGYVEVQDPTTEGSVGGVHLKRRVARFDIINNADYSNFEVTQIIVSRAQKTGWLQDIAFDASSLPSGWPATTGKTIIDGTNANGTPSSKVDTFNIYNSGVNGADGIPDDFQNGNKFDHDSCRYEINPAVFYLWPTMLKQNTDASNNEIAVSEGTEIVIEGKYYGTTRFYRLNLTADQEIEANKIYRIKIERKSETQLKFELITVDHWDEDVEISTTPSGSNLDWTKASFAAAGGSSSVATLDLTQAMTVSTPGAYKYSSTSTDSAKITIVTMGTNLTSTGHTSAIDIKGVGKDGTNYIGSDLADTKAYINSTTTLTYGTAIYVTTHVITLPPTIAPIETQLEISNPANEQDAKIIRLNGVCFNKAGKAKAGTLLNTASYPSLLSFGTSSRWPVAAVTDVDATGMPTKVVAYFGSDLPSKLNVSSVKSIETVLGEIAASATLSASIKQYAAANAGRTATGISDANMRTAFTALGQKPDDNATYGIYVVQAVTTVNQQYSYTTTAKPTVGRNVPSDDWFWIYAKTFVCPLTY